MVGQKIGDYRIVRLLGQGGMGEVYEALNELIGGRVAIKILNADCAREEELVARFFNEARAVNLIDHPSLVKVMHHGRLDGGKPYLVMEFLSGQTLDDRIVERGGRLSEAEAARIMHQVALALILSNGKVHRIVSTGITSVAQLAKTFHRVW